MIRLLVKGVSKDRVLLDFETDNGGKMILTRNGTKAGKRVVRGLMTSNNVPVALSTGDYIDLTDTKITNLSRYLDEYYSMRGESAD